VEVDRNLSNGSQMKINIVSWLEIQRSGFDSLRYQTFWEAVGLERCPLNFVSTVEELLERKISGSGLKKTEITGVGDPPRWPRDTPPSSSIYHHANICVI
jgi:hypothetical protein